MFINMSGTKSTSAGSWNSGLPLHKDSGTYLTQMLQAYGSKSILDSSVGWHISSENKSLDLYVIPTALCLGLVANFLVIVTFMATPLRRASLSHYVTAVAVADMAYILASFMVWSSFHGLDIYTRTGGCQVTTYTLYLSHFLSTWFLLSVHVERCLVHFASAWTKKWCNVFMTKSAIIAITVFSMVAYLYVLWLYTADVKDGTHTCSLKGESVIHIENLYKMEMIFAWVIPTVTMLVVDAALVRTLVIRRRRGRKKPSAIAMDYLPSPLSQAQEYRSDLPRERALDLPRERDIDLPRECAPDTPKERDIDLPIERDLDLPRERALHLPRERNLDLHRKRDIDLPIERDLDLPRERNLDLPRKRDIDLPRQCTLDLPRECTLDLLRECALDLSRERALDRPRECALDLPRECTLDLLRECAPDIPIERALDLPRERAFDLPRERAFDLPRERALDLPKERALDLPRERSLDLPGERDIDLPGERDFGLPRECAPDTPIERALDHLRERDIDLPRERHLDLPRERHLDLPRERDIDLARERNIDLARERDTDLARERDRSTLACIILGLVFAVLQLPTFCLSAMVMFDVQNPRRFHFSVLLSIVENLRLFNAVYKIILYVLILKSFRQALKHLFGFPLGVFVFL